jgi:hypothetical protein
MEIVDTIKRALIVRPFFFFVSLVVISSLYAIFSGIFKVDVSLLTIYGFQMSIYAFISLLSISILSSILLTLEYHNLRTSMGAKKIPVSKKSFLGYIGAGFSFFTTVCPFCKPLLITFFGVGGAFGLFQTYGMQITFLSVCLLLVSIYLVATTKKTCSG